MKNKLESLINRIVFFNKNIEFKSRIEANLREDLTEFRKIVTDFKNEMGKDPELLFFENKISDFSSMLNVVNEKKKNIKKNNTEISILKSQFINNLKDFMP